MKSILLHTAAVSNGGAFIAAGTTVTVGDEDDQISAARAESLPHEEAFAPEAPKSRK